MPRRLGRLNVWEAPSGPEVNSPEPTAKYPWTELSLDRITPTGPPPRSSTGFVRVPCGTPQCCKRRTSGDLQLRDCRPVERQGSAHWRATSSWPSRRRATARADLVGWRPHLARLVLQRRRAGRSRRPLGISIMSEFSRLGHTDINADPPWRFERWQTRLCEFVGHRPPLPGSRHRPPCLGHHATIPVDLGPTNRRLGRCFLGPLPLDALDDLRERAWLQGTRRAFPPSGC